VFLEAEFWVHVDVTADSDEFVIDGLGFRQHEKNPPANRE
jgi:hypothetical protein